MSRDLNYYPFLDTSERRTCLFSSRDEITMLGIVGQGFPETVKQSRLKKPNDSDRTLPERSQRFIWDGVAVSIIFCFFYSQCFIASRATRVWPLCTYIFSSFLSMDGCQTGGGSEVKERTVSRGISRGDSRRARTLCEVNFKTCAYPKRGSRTGHPEAPLSGFCFRDSRDLQLDKVPFSTGLG